MILVLGGGKPPPKCFRLDADGNLPTCTSFGDGEWQVSYTDAGSGPGGGFVLLMVLVLIGGLAFTIWKVSTARRMARESGMSERDATAMALLTDDGFESTYLAANLRGQRPAGSDPAAEAAASPGVRDRLAELKGLHDQGLVTDEEYAAARQKILDDL